MVSGNEVERSINSQTDKVWDGAPLNSLVSFVVNEVNSCGTQLTQRQTDALNKSLVYASKSITKNSVTATFNVLMETGILNSK